MTRRIAKVGLALVLVLAPSVAFAQLTLPDARAVLKRYAEAVGAAKLATAPGLHMKGTYEIPSAGLTGTFEAFTNKAGRSASVINITSIGTMLAGSDSVFAWTLDPIQGPRILEGKEYLQHREEEDHRAMGREPFFVLEAKSLVRTTVEGETCIKLELKWKSGRTSAEYFSEKTGLLLQVETTQLTSMGEVPVTRVYGEYKTFSGLTLPTKVIERTQGLEAIQHVTDVILEPIDDAKLVVPAQIQALRRG